MKTFPIHALSRRYTLGTPKRRIIDTGVATMQLGNGVMRARDELGQAIYAYDLHLTALPWADIEILDGFYIDHKRGVTPFYWADPVTYLTYPMRFDPATPPRIVPSTNVPDHCDVDITVLPVIPTVAEAMLVAHWKMNDDAADTVVLDATGNGHAGTASHNTSTMTVPGRIATALEFSAASSRYVRVTDHTDLRLTGGGTICFWAKWDGTHEVTGSAYTSLCAQAGNAWRIWLTGLTGTLGFRTPTMSAGAAYSTTGALVAGTWRHIAVVLCPVSSTRRFFVDGVEATASNGDGAMPSGNAGDVYLGSYDTISGLFGGVLDDVRIYQRPLTVAEIQALYNGGSGTEEAIVP